MGRSRRWRDQLPQLLAFQVLHHDEQAARVLAQVVDCDDVGVAQLGTGLRFAEESRPQLIALVYVLGDDLEGDHALQQGVARLVHGAHSAPPDLLRDLVLAQFFDHPPLDLFGAPRAAPDARGQVSGAATGRSVCPRLTAGRPVGFSPLIREDFSCPRCSPDADRL